MKRLYLENRTELFVHISSSPVDIYLHLITRLIFPTCCTPSKALCHATLVCTPDTRMCVDYNIRQFVLAHHTMKMFLNLFTRKDCTLQVV